MKKLVTTLFLLTVFATAACSASNDTDTNSSDRKAEHRADCSERSDSLDREGTNLQNEGDDINPFDTSAVRSFIRDGREFVAEGRDISSDCGDLLDSSTKDELDSLLDEMEDSLDGAEDAYNSVFNS